tara:strand:- start:515 stop:910 length:396 start_codon:yes stop_codon:yes gene_type:complete
MIFDWFNKEKSKIADNKENLIADDIFLNYSKAQENLNNKEYKLAVQNFDKVIDTLPNATNVPAEIMSMTAFALSDMSVSFSLIDVYHNRGCAKFYTSDDSSIDDFTEAIKIHKDYENAHLILHCLVFTSLS